MINLKVMCAAVCWTAAVGAAIARSADNRPGMGVWVVILAAVACCVTGALIVDYVAKEVAKFMLEKIHEEREATVAAAVEVMRSENGQLADKIVERLANKQDKSLERMAGGLADALADQPTPFRRN